MTGNSVRNGALLQFLLVVAFLTTSTIGFHRGDRIFCISGIKRRNGRRLSNEVCSATLQSDTLADVSSPLDVTDLVNGAVESKSKPKAKQKAGLPHTEETKAKISAANKGKKSWNTGKTHSEETKQRIREKTKEAMLKVKIAKAEAMGLTLEEYDAKREVEKQEKKKEKDKLKPKGLTEEGRKRLSEGLKKRWQDPEYRSNHTGPSKGTRAHSNETRARIAESVRLRWQDEEYRSKMKRNQPDEEVRKRISATLKARWEEPEFREKMLTRSFPRTDEWRALVSQRIREKWSDPNYRTAVTLGLKGVNRTISVTRRPRVVSESTLARRREREMKKIEREAQKAAKLKEKQRKTAIREAKALAKSKRSASAGGGSGSGAGGAGGESRKSIKDVLGGELWFEEKMKRRKAGESFMDDAALEAELSLEWQQQQDDDEEEEEDDIEDDLFKDSESGEEPDEDEDELVYEGDEDLWMGLDPDALDEALDVIEVYDDEGNLVGTYTGEEFDRLKRSQR